MFVDSDSDSELSVDEHSSSYASSHSSDSEDEDIEMKPKWNNERQPLHSTPKGTKYSFLPNKIQVKYESHKLNLLIHEASTHNPIKNITHNI